MINPAELRIGNLVTIDNKLRLEQNGYIFKVEAIENHSQQKSISLSPLNINSFNFGQLQEHVCGIPFTEEWLLKFGFEKAPLTQWFGNGQDYQEETSQTIQQDYFIDGFFVRFEKWAYKKNGEWLWDEPCVSMLKNKWYIRCQENFVPNWNIKYVHQFQNIYFAIMEKELTITEPN